MSQVVNDGITHWIYQRLAGMELQVSDDPHSQGWLNLDRDGRRLGQLMIWFTHDYVGVLIMLPLRHNQEDQGLTFLLDEQYELADPGIGGRIEDDLRRTVLELRA